MDRPARFAWLVLAYNVLVILWGAVVRATGSGAGCGNHWPLCNGEVLPRAAEVETLIELSHRTTSGLALLAVVALLVWVFRARPAGHPARAGAVASLILILTEAGIGAGLVLFELVAANDSLARALSMAAHLVNTFALLGALTLTAHWLSGGAPLRLRARGWVTPGAGLGLLAVALVGTSGAVAALGDTLFPAGSLAEALRQDLSPTAHILVRLRLIHPAVSIATGVYLIALAILLPLPREDRTAVLASRAVPAVAVAQLLVGALNVALLAPVGMQILHLLLADLLWIALVLLVASALAAPGPERRASPEAAVAPAG